MSEGYRITEMFAFVTIDADDDEGVPAFFSAELGAWMPMMGADMARVEALRPRAQGMARELGKRIELVRFTVREHLETIE